VNDKILGIVAKEISPDDMKRFAQVLLGFSEAEVSNVTYAPRWDPYKTNYEMLSTWRNRNNKAKRNTVTDLMKALRKALRKGFDTTRAINKLNESKISGWLFFFFNPSYIVASNGLSMQ